MVVCIGYITIGDRDYPVLLTADGMYRVKEDGSTEKIYIKRSEIHKERCA